MREAGQSSLNLLEDVAGVIFVGREDGGIGIVNFGFDFVDNGIILFVGQLAPFKKSF